jgi:hypothetical protein
VTLGGPRVGDKTWKAVYEKTIKDINRSQRFVLLNDPVPDEPYLSKDILPKIPIKL